jgi:hypothetical protein
MHNSIFPRRIMNNRILLFVFLVSISLTACNTVQPVPTQDAISAIYTEAVSTLNAGATMTAAVVTPTFTETATATITPTSTATATAAISTTAGSGGTNLSQCDVAEFVADVTIPDGANVAPGQTFTKTWQIRNDGTCTWNSNYKIVYYSGERLNTSNNYQLTTVNVAPGETLEVSIIMVAPTQAGEYMSNWLLQNSSGLYFGIGASGGVLYVQFVVSGATATVTQTATQTAAPTATETVEPSATSTPE